MYKSYHHNFEDTILVADPHPQMRIRLQSSLSDRYNIVLTESTQKTWELAKNTELDLIILNDLLPSMGGLKLLRLLKIAYPQVPVLFTSNNPPHNWSLQAFRNGARDCFQLPGDLEILYNRINQFFHNLSQENHWGKNFYLNDRKDLTDDEIRMLQNLKPTNKHGISKVIEYLHKNFKENISKDQLTELACLSSSHFSRVFKEHTGCSYIKYLTHLRINEAKKLLKDRNLTITEVCYLVGYRDLSNFERTFHKIVGCCPRDYR